MKKYFIAETDEELQFGDTLELDFSKKTKHGLHTVKGEIQLSELSLPLLLEIGAVEEREVNEDFFDFVGEEEENCEALADLIEDFETLEERVDRLEALASDLLKEQKRIIKTVLREAKDTAEKPTAQPKKK